MTAISTGSVSVDDAPRASRRVFTPSRSTRAAARLARLRRWEFWPSWAVYAPLIPHFALLAFKHRGLTTCTLANPGMPLGGLLGESKSSILRSLPAEWVLPCVLIPEGPPDARMVHLLDAMTANEWSWPVVLKPDAGYRGRGVQLVRDRSEAAAYLSMHPGPVIAQVYHPGPGEAGIFYVRQPRDAHGRIFSITAKRFPVAVGDGRATLRELIWRHPRHRLQAGALLTNLGENADTVPALGEKVPLTHAGNHCRGTMFLDGEQLRTPELERTIDEIAKATPGFFFGRFDVRYEREEDLRAGRNFRIVELNGLTSESTNIYDPATPFWKAQSVLRKQWSLAFQVGSEVRAMGPRTPGLWAVVREIRRARRSQLVCMKAISSSCPRS